MNKKIKYILLIFLFIITSFIIFHISKRNKPIPESTQITLKGNHIVTIELGNKYIEPGYIAKDSIKGDITNKVKIKGNVNTNKEGTYQLTYTITNSKKETTNTHRFIKVTAPKTITYKDEYDKLDNKSRGWWSGNKFDGQRPAGGADINELKKYNAYFVGKDEKVIYLTFDEGSNETYVKEIVNVLNENNVKATFFLCLKYMQSNAELVKEMADAGHTIGNHTAKHLNMPSLATKETFNQYLEEIKRVEASYYKITGKQMEKVYRDPRGEWSYRDLQIMKDLGYSSYFYSADYLDFKEDVPKEKALANLTKRVHNGAIYLMHPKNKGNYLALDPFIKQMKKQGYKFDLVKNIPNN